MFNHSCLRCRSKKLRCDDGTPCTNCDSKGLGHVCHRPKRKERPRKKDTVRLPGPAIAANAVSSQTIAAAAIHATAPTSSPPSSTASSVVAGPTSRPTDGGSYAGSSLSVARSKVSAIRDSPTSVQVDPTARASASGSKPRPAIKFDLAPAQLRDRLATEEQIAEARELLGNVIGAIRVVKYIFHWRCQGNCHSSVHIPTIKQLIRQLYSEKWATEMTQDQLSLLLMVGAHSIQFTPRRGPYMYVLKMVEDLGSNWTPPVRQRKLHHLARSILQARLTDDVYSLEGIQTAILLLLYDLDDDRFKEHVFHYAIRAAKNLGLDHIQYETGVAVPSLEAEMGARTWWFLVSRDWLSSLGRGTFMLPPDSFSTRLPLLISDDDLAEGRSVNAQDGQTSPVAISMPHISLAAMVRELVEARSMPGQTEQNLCQLVADAFDQYCEKLPPVFGLQAGATFTPGAGASPDIYVIQRLETERWLLHQQIFHAYLQLYNLRPEEPVCDQMVALARHILELQDTIRTRCHIIDHMRINVLGVLRAIMVLTVDLIQRHRDAKVSLVRQLTLGKVHDSLRKTRDAPALNEGDLNDVNRLLDMEERMWKAKQTAPVLPALTRTGSGGKTAHDMSSVFSAMSTTSLLPFGNTNVNVLSTQPELQHRSSHPGSSEGDDVMMQFPAEVTAHSISSSMNDHRAGSSPSTSESPGMIVPMLGSACAQGMRHSSGDIPQLKYTQAPQQDSAPPTLQSGGRLSGSSTSPPSYMYAPNGPIPVQQQQQQHHQQQQQQQLRTPSSTLHPSSARSTDASTSLYDVHSLLPSDSALSPLFAMHGLTGSGGIAPDSMTGFRGGVTAMLNGSNAIKTQRASDAGVGGPHAAMNADVGQANGATSGSMPSSSGSDTPLGSRNGSHANGSANTEAEPTWETIWSFLMQSSGPSHLHQPPSAPHPSSGPHDQGSFSHSFPHQNSTPLPARQGSSQDNNNLTRASASAVGMAAHPHPRHDDGSSNNGLANPNASGNGYGPTPHQRYQPQHQGQHPPPQQQHRHHHHHHDISHHHPQSDHQATAMNMPMSNLAMAMAGPVPMGVRTDVA